MRKLPFVIAMMCIMHINSSCNLFAPSLSSIEKSTEFVEISSIEAEQMILKFPSATQPLNKITFKPAFLKELNRYHQFHVTFIPALYISEEQAARYRSRWQISDPADSLGAVINKATLLVKVIDKRGNVRYFDEGGICPPPDNCKFPSIPR